MTENDVNDDSPDEKTTLRRGLGFYRRIIKAAENFSFGARAALAICLFFTAFIWLSAAKSSDAEKEVAENFELTKLNPFRNQNGDETKNSADVSDMHEANDNFFANVSQTRFRRQIRESFDSRMDSTKTKSQELSARKRFRSRQLKEISPSE